jgi:cbb3-type cytochrome oxidase maturation protein
MTALAWLVPVALALGGAGLAAFLWSLSSGQFEDLEGAGWRALDDERDANRPQTPIGDAEQQKSLGPTPP